MQLAGPHVFGPPAHRATAVAVLRAVVKLGITHIDTSDFFGPYMTNEILREALSPYAPELHVVTKVGSLRDAEGNWPQARSRDQLRQAAHGNLSRLRLDVLDAVNFRVGAVEGPIPGSIAEQLAAAQSIAPVVTVQNLHNIANRQDDALIDSLAAQGISYVSYFPLGGFTPLQSHVLDAVALRLEASPMPVALAWLLQRLPNILLIPGTSSLAHLYENAAGATLKLPADAVEELDSIGG